MAEREDYSAPRVLEKRGARLLGFHASQAELRSHHFHESDLKASTLVHMEPINYLTEEREHDDTRVLHLSGSITGIPWDLEYAKSIHFTFNDKYIDIGCMHHGIRHR